MAHPLVRLVELLSEPAIVRDLAGRELYRNPSAHGLQVSDDWVRIELTDAVVLLGPPSLSPAGRRVDLGRLFRSQLVGVALFRQDRLVDANTLLAGMLGRQALQVGIPFESLFAGEPPEVSEGAVEGVLLHHEGYRVEALLEVVPLGPEEQLLLVQDLGTARGPEARLRVLFRSDAALREAEGAQQAATRLAEALVPDLADVCYVHLADGASTRSVGVAHREPTRTATLDALKAVEMPEPMSLLVRDWKGPDGRRGDLGRTMKVLRSHGVRSSLWVPVELYGAPVGQIALHRLEDRAPFDSSDLELAHELAAASSLALRQWRLSSELQREGSTFRALVESTPLLVFSASPDGRFSYLNRRWAEYTGLPLDRIRDAGWRNLVHPDDIETTRRAFRSRTDDNVQVRVRLRNLEGAWRWFLVRASGAHDTNGDMVRWVGSCIDIHEPTRREEHATFMAAASAALTEPANPSRALSRLAITPVPSFADYCAIYLCEGEHCRLAHLHHRSPALAERIRALHQRHPLKLEITVGPARVLHTGRAEIVHLPLHDSAEPGPFEAMGDAGVTSMILAPMRVDGEALGALIFASSSRRVYDDRDREVAEEVGHRAALFLQNARLYAIARSEREKAEEANRLKDAFLAMLSHELRTPLSALAGWTQLLVRGRVPPEQVAHAISVIERNASSLTQLIDDLLDVSRIVSGQLRLVSQPVDLATQVRRAVDSVRPIAREKGVVLETHIEPVGLVDGDPERLRQAAWNLLSNAVKFTPHGGRVTVSLSERENRAVLVVFDSGIGIEPEFMGRLFDPFRQADSSMTRAHGGLGLGLAIVKHVIDAHGGSIHAVSPGTGGGASFTVLLPLRRGEASRELLEEAEVTDQLEDVLVLVVESDPDTRDLLTTLLQNAGARVVHASDASEARASLWRDRPDLLLADIRLPGEDGLSLMRSIRRLPPDQGGNVPAVGLTAFASDVDRRKALQAGYQAHASKPVDPGQLIELLRTVWLASRR